MTEEDRKQVIRELTSKAGKGRLKTMSPAERSKSASKAAKARWKAYRAQQKGKIIEN